MSVTKPGPDTTHLYLIRHGATAANENVPFILQGAGIDLQLSPSGEQQALDVGAQLSGIPLNRIYSSTLLRARQTAQAIADRQNLEVEIVSNLHESDVGLWEGKNIEEIQREFPEEYRKFMENPGDNPHPGGESFQDVLERVHPILNELLHKHAGESIAVVAHGNVNRVYLAHLLGVELRKAQLVRQVNGCINIVHHQSHETRVMTLNAILHLQHVVAAKLPK